MNRYASRNRHRGIDGSRRILVMATGDGGETWRRTQIPISERASFHADPMVTFDSRGVAYLAHIPATSANDPVGIEVTRSLDGGITWKPSQRISSNFDEDDKVIIHADDEIESPFRRRAGWRTCCTECPAPMGGR